MAIIKEIRNNKRWQEHEGKRTLVYYWWECKLVQPLWKTVWRFLKKLKIELLYDLAIPLLDIYPKEIKSLCQRDICTPEFIAALFIIAKTWKQPKCPSMDKENVLYIYNGVLLSHNKRIKICYSKQHGWTWRVLCLVKSVRQRKTNTVSFHLYVEFKKQNKLINIAKQKQTQRYRE